jgi:superfamily II DNA or RNA helicase
MPPVALRKWQTSALEKWRGENCRGIVSVVTGGGKTIFALACVKAQNPLTTLVVVPTAALLDQWWDEIAAFFGLRLDDVNVITGGRNLRVGTINIAVLNTAAVLARRDQPECLLIVDECHKAASPSFRKVLELKTVGSLGLSATPERPYDEGLSEILVPALGPVIFNYDYASARQDGVIVPFTLKNIIFELEPERQAEYEKLTKAIGRSIKSEGSESEKTIALLLRRSRILNLSQKRIYLTAKLVAANKGKKTLIFHENVDACEVITTVLKAFNVRAGVYHSRMPVKKRVEMLTRYRAGDLQVLVTCRALDEGFNVPETEVGIIAASTATRRQRIQRLGRIVRPATGKEEASIYTLVATGPEIARLQEEEQELEGVANVTWATE